MLRTSTRSPTRESGTPSPTATTRPHTSAPWIRGKVRGVPDQLASSSAAVSNPAAPPCSVPAETPLEYHPIRVLMSVLLMPAAATWIDTWPGAGSGTGTSVR